MSRYIPPIPQTGKFLKYDKDNLNPDQINPLIIMHKNKYNKQKIEFRNIDQICEVNSYETNINNSDQPEAYKDIVYKGEDVIVIKDPRFARHGKEKYRCFSFKEIDNIMHDSSLLYRNFFDSSKKSILYYSKYNENKYIDDTILVYNKLASIWNTLKIQKYDIASNNSPRYS